MDKLIIENKIESLRKCLLRVEQRCPDSLEALLQDLDAQDVLVLNLSRAIQLCVDISVHILSGLEQPIPDTMGKAFSELSSAGIIDIELAEEMRKAVGFRNIAVHDYEEVSFEIVYTIAKHKLIDFKSFVKQILAVIES
jgi:uncharacterized protein YutE (UPF0331/DUF86 family)